MSHVIMGCDGGATAPGRRRRDTRAMDTREMLRVASTQRECAPPRSRAGRVGPKRARALAKGDWHIAARLDVREAALVPASAGAAAPEVEATTAVSVRESAHLGDGCWPLERLADDEVRHVDCWGWGSRCWGCGWDWRDWRRAGRKRNRHWHGHSRATTAPAPASALAARLTWSALCPGGIGRCRCRSRCGRCRPDAKTLARFLPASV
jgi:hypothetical protein